jgi:hypothetical protein
LTSDKASEAGQTMNYIESYLVPLLGQSMDDPRIKQAISGLELVDIDENPEMRRCYIGADKKGITLLFEDNRFDGIQIHVGPTKRYSAFADPLPFGIEKGMSQAEIHELLGEPEAFDKFDSRYCIENGRVRLIVWYNDCLLVRYLSIGLPL